MTPTLLPVSAVAERWSCSPGKIRQMITKGELRSVRLGGHTIRIPLEEIERCENLSQPKLVSIPSETSSEQKEEQTRPSQHGAKRTVSDAAFDSVRT
jgi:excisionase family DNA binding protein